MEHPLRAKKSIENKMIEIETLLLIGVDFIISLISQARFGIF